VGVPNFTGPCEDSVGASFDIVSQTVELIAGTDTARVTVRHSDPDGQTVEIQKRTFSSPVQGGVKAKGTLTLSANVSADDTVTIGTTVYTYKASPAAAYEVDVGTDAAISATNLIAAINDSGGSGYHASTVAHVNVTAAEVAGSDSVLATAKVAGSQGNAIATTEAGTNTAWGAVTLESDLDIEWLTHLDNSPDPVPTGVLSDDTIGVNVFEGVTSWVQVRLKYLDVNSATLYSSPITSSGFDQGRQPNVITFEAIADQNWNVSPHVEVDFDSYAIKIAGVGGVTPTQPTDSDVTDETAANVTDTNVGRTFDRLETAMFYTDFPIVLAKGETAIFKAQSYSEIDGTGRTSEFVTCETTRPADEIGGGDPTLGDGVTLTVTDDGGDGEDYLIDWTATDANITSSHYVYIEVFKYGEGSASLGNGTENDPSTGGTQTMTINPTPYSVGGMYRAEVYLKLDADDSILDHRTIYDELML